MFGSCHYIVADLLPRWGIETVLVDGRDLGAWEAALAGGAAVAFCESPSNPAMEIIDLAEVARLTHRAGGILVVDNVFATPLLQKPLALGADVVVYSATKHIDGQGRCLGGAILASREIPQGRSRAVLPPHRPVAEPVQRLAAAKGAGDPGAAGRTAMPHRRGDRPLSRKPSEDHARHLSGAAEPSAIRAGAAADESGRQPRRFDIAGDKEACFRFLDALRLVDISNNLGDSKSLVTHPGDDDAFAAQTRGAAPNSASATAWCGFRRGSKPRPI